MPANPRITISMDQNTRNLFNEASALALITPAAIVDRLLSPHVPELLYWTRWMKSLEPGSDKEFRGRHALQSYGRRSLVEQVHHIDPSYADPTGARTDTDTEIDSKLVDEIVRRVRDALSDQLQPKPAVGNDAALPKG